MDQRKKEEMEKNRADHSKGKARCPRAELSFSESMSATHLRGGSDGPEAVVGQRVELRARVEGPGEGEPGGRVGLDGAVDGGDLAVRHAVHHLLVVGAHRLVCKCQESVIIKANLELIFKFLSFRTFHSRPPHARHYSPLFVPTVVLRPGARNMGSGNFVLNAFLSSACTLEIATTAPSALRRQSQSHSSPIAVHITTIY